MGLWGYWVARVAFGRPRPLTLQVNGTGINTRWSRQRLFLFIFFVISATQKGRSHFCSIYPEQYKWNLPSLAFFTYCLGAADLSTGS